MRTELQDNREQLLTQQARIEALERWILGQGPRPAPTASLLLAPPDKFIGEKPKGPDGDFHVRPWLEAMEAWFMAQPSVLKEDWLPIALSYMDHSGRTTWTHHLIPELTTKFKLAHPQGQFCPSWTDFKPAMIERFGGQAARFAATKLKGGKCKYASSMHEYSSRFRALVDKANEASDTQSAISPREQASLFLDGLPREMRIFLAGGAPAEGFPTLAECETFCTLKQTEYNKLYPSAQPQTDAAPRTSSFRPRRPRSPSRGKDRPFGHKRRRPDPPSSSKPGGSSRPTSRPEPRSAGDRTVTCSFCNHFGHHVSECRKKARAASTSQDASKPHSHPKGKEKKGF